MLIFFGSKAHSHFLYIFFVSVCGSCFLVFSQLERKLIGYMKQRPTENTLDGRFGERMSEISELKSERRCLLRPGGADDPLIALKKKIMK